MVKKNVKVTREMWICGSNSGYHADMMTISTGMQASHEPSTTLIALQ